MDNQTRPTAEQQQQQSVVPAAALPHNCSIDDALAFLAAARTVSQRLDACEALAEAANREAQQLGEALRKVQRAAARRMTSRMDGWSTEKILKLAPQEGGAL